MSDEVRKRAEALVDEIHSAIGVGRLSKGLRDQLVSDVLRFHGQNLLAIAEEARPNFFEHTMFDWFQKKASQAAVLDHLSPDLDETEQCPIEIGTRWRKKSRRAKDHTVYEVRKVEMGESDWMVGISSKQSGTNLWWYDIGFFLKVYVAVSEKTT